LWPEFLPIRRRKSSFCPSRYTGGGIVVGDAADTISAPPVKHSTHPTDARYTPHLAGRCHEHRIHELNCLMLCTMPMVTAQQVHADTRHDAVVRCT
jgi:hypothetical protein